MERVVNAAASPSPGNFEIAIEGVPWVRGDEKSITVAFWNLHGRNWKGAADPRLEHRQWIASMEATFGMPLPDRALVNFQTSAGEVLLQCLIGEGFDSYSPPQQPEPRMPVPDPEPDYEFRVVRSRPRVTP